MNNKTFVFVLQTISQIFFVCKQLSRLQVRYFVDTLTLYHIIYHLSILIQNYFMTFYKSKIFIKATYHTRAF